jgi:hypothetical protein
VVEHSLGKGEVDSSILSGSTSRPDNPSACDLRQLLILLKPDLGVLGGGGSDD